MKKTADKTAACMSAKKKRTAAILAAVCAVAVIGMFFLNTESMTFDFFGLGSDKNVTPSGTSSGIQLYRPDWETDIFKRSDWLEKRRFITYTEGAMSIGLVDGNYSAYGEPVEMFGEYFDALMHGDAERLNSFYSEEWLQENGSFERFTMQKIYDMRVEYLTRNDSAQSGVTYWYYKISYKIMENDGTFRDDVMSDGERPQYYIVTDNGSELKISYVGYTRPF